MPEKKNAKKKPAAKKAAPKKPAPARKPAKAAKPKPAARAPEPPPPSRMARAIEQREQEHDGNRRPSLARPEPAQQLGLPDIDQVRDDIMERHYVDLEDAKAARKAAQKRIHEVEAAIQVRFDQFREADEDDPRCELYIVANGAPLKPETVHKISCGRPPAQSKKALEEAKRKAAEDEPNLPDDGDG